MRNIMKSCLSLLLWFVTFQLLGQHNHNQQSRVDPDRTRMYWQMPIRVMDELGIKDGMTIADVGAGNGYFTFHLSKQVGEKGKVYASDIDNNALQIIRDRCAENGISNITVISGTEDDPLLPEEVVDMVLIVNTIHLVNNPTLFLKNTTRSLKIGGYLVIIQWDADKMKSEAPKWDPEDQAKYTLRTNLSKIYDADLEVIQIKDFLPMQTIFICQPKAK